MVVLVCRTIDSTDLIELDGAPCNTVHVILDGHLNCAIDSPLNLVVHAPDKDVHLAPTHPAGIKRKDSPCRVMGPSLIWVSRTPGINFRGLEKGRTSPPT